jgi:hypothetical protein
MPFRHAPIGLLVALLASALLPALAGATRPGVWNPVTSANGVNIDQVGLVRTPDGKLHVAWQRKTPGHEVDEDLMQTAIDPSGAIAGPQVVAADWLGIGSPAIARAADGSLLIVAGATQVLTPGAIDNFGAWRSTDGGATWAQVPGEAGLGGGFADPVSLAFGSDGATPFFAWGTTFGLHVHRGLSETEATGDFQTANGFGCCGYDPGIALDGASGQLVVAWYSNADDHEGVFGQAVDQATGNPAGALERMPGSVTSYAGSDNSSSTLARTAVVSRPGKPGVFVGYTGDYPTTTQALVWRFGSRQSSIVGRRSGGIGHVALASDAAGRVWAVWSGGTRVYARRSNKDATSWGPVVSVAARRGTDTIFKLAANAQSDVVDVLAAFSPSSTGDVQTWHTQLRPGLKLTAAPRRLALGGRGTQAVTLKVTDAGVPVAGAKVKLAGESATTGRAGTVTLAVGPFNRRKRLLARAIKDDYVAGTAIVRVRR